MTVITTAVLITGLGALWLALRAHLRRIDADVEDLLHELRSWQASYDHHVTSLDRRMCEVEAAAASAEREGQIISNQVGDLAQWLGERVERAHHMRIDLQPESHMGEGGPR